MFQGLKSGHAFLKEKQVFLYIYYLSVAAILIGFIYSRALLSIGQIALAANFLLEGDLITKAKRLGSNKMALLFWGIYFLHVFFLLNTTDFSYAMKDLRVKMPLLLFPVVMSCADIFDRRAFRITLFLFIAVILSYTLVIASRVFFSPDGVTDFRDASIFISHIRLSLMICLCMAICIYYSFKLERKYAILLILLCVYFEIFMWKLTYFTGIGISAFLFMMMFFWYLRKSSLKRNFKFLILGVIIIGIGSVSGYLINATLDYYKNSDERESVNLKRSDSGAYYVQWHKIHNNYARENGHLVFQNICSQELEASWNAISEHKVDYSDEDRTDIEDILLRFLASKGLPKNAESVYSLSRKEIKAIEEGITNVRYMGKPALYIRINELLWQYDVVMIGGNINGHSLGMRIEFWKTGWKIFRDNFWFGTGTGDIEQAFQEQYVKDNSILRPEWRFRSHNQYISFGAAFGVFGLLYFLIAVFSPLPLKRKDFLYMSFSLIFILSMITEDTLETQIGVTFYAFFNGLLFFQNRELKD